MLHNPQSNCLPKVVKRSVDYKKTVKRPMPGAPVEEIITFEAVFPGKQQVLLVKERGRADPNKYGEYLARNDENVRVIHVDIGETANEERPCEA